MCLIKKFILNHFKKVLNANTKSNNRLISYQQDELFHSLKELISKEIRFKNIDTKEMILDILCNNKVTKQIKIALSKSDVYYDLALCTKTNKLVKQHFPFDYDAQTNNYILNKSYILIDVLIQFNELFLILMDSKIYPMILKFYTSVKVLKMIQNFKTII